MSTIPILPRPAPESSGPATAPVTPPASSSSPNPNRLVPKYGQLNSKPHLYYLTNLSAPQLLFITQTAPFEHRRTLSATDSVQVLLDEVFRLRQIESLGEQQGTDHHQANARELLSLTSEQLLSLSASNLTRLRSLMHSSIQLDPSLTPSTIPEDISQCVVHALSWKLSALTEAQAAYRSAHLRDGQQLPNQNPVASTILPQSHIPSIPQLMRPQTIPPTTHNNQLDHRHEDSEEEDEVGGSRKRGRSQLRPKGWSAGRGDAIRSKLQHYPGKGMASTALAVEEPLGPELFLHMTSGGTDIPTYIRTIDWAKASYKRPLPSENEAVTLARMIHLEMLMHESPWEALENRPSLEVGLRRLYALVHVELASKQPDLYLSRSQAWAEIDPILEVTPSPPLHCPPVTDTITKHMTMHRKRIQSIKALTENKQSRAAQTPQTGSNPRTRNPPENSTQQTGE